MLSSWAIEWWMKSHVSNTKCQTQAELLLSKNQLIIRSCQGTNRGEAESVLMQLHKCVVLSQLASAAGHRFSEKGIADLGDVHKGIEDTHNDEVFLRKQKEYRDLHVGKR